MEREAKRVEHDAILPAACYYMDPFCGGGKDRKTAKTCSTHSQKFPGFFLPVLESIKHLNAKKINGNPASFSNGKNKTRQEV